jgi:hypothetical protein
MKSATKRCRRRSRAPPSLTAKRAAWTDMTGTDCLPRRLAGPSSSSRKPIIFYEVLKATFWNQKRWKGKAVDGLYSVHNANCRKIGKIYLLSNEFVVIDVYFLFSCDCQIKYNSFVGV